MLANALPRKILQNLKLQYENLKSSDPGTITIKKGSLHKYRRNYLTYLDEKLHSIKPGDHFLRLPKIAQIVANSIHYWDSKRLDILPVPS